MSETAPERERMADAIAEKVAGRIRELLDWPIVMAETGLAAIVVDLRDDLRAALAAPAAPDAPDYQKAHGVLAAFARTAPGRLPAEVQAAVDLAPWDGEAVRRVAAPEAPLSVEPNDGWLREYERRKLALLEAAHPVSQPSGYSEDEADAFYAAERALDRWVSGSPAARQLGADAELVVAFRDPRCWYDVKHLPDGWRKVEVYTNGEAVVVCGFPGEDESHNCDEMGCGSVGPHVLHRARLSAPARPGSEGGEAP